MSKYRKIDTRIWNDEKFRGLGDDGKLIFLLLLTHPGMTSLGALPAIPDGLAHMLKWSRERFREGLSQPLAEGMIEADEDAGLFCLPNFLRYNPPENPNVVKAWASSVDLLPECGLKNTVMARAYEAVKARPKPFGEAFVKLFGKPLPNGSANRYRNHMPNQEPEQEQEPEQDEVLQGGKQLHSTMGDAPEPNIMEGMSSEEIRSHVRKTAAQQDDSDAATDYPIDPPETVEEGRRFLERRGVKPHDLDPMLAKLMAFRLYQSDLNNGAGHKPEILVSDRLADSALVARRKLAQQGNADAAAEMDF
jgi:hypothetical protein